MGKRGYLTKEGGHHKSWKRRWCTLSGTTLSYFKEPEDLTPAGVIYVEEYSTAVVTNDRPKQKCCFALRPTDDTNRIYYFSADNDADMHDWISAINAAIASSHLRRGRVMKEYLTIDVFVDSGIRVSGKQQAGLLSLLSGDALSASKHIDERGWFCDRVALVQDILQSCSQFGWTLQSAYESSSIGLSTSLGTSVVPASTLIFARPVAPKIPGHQGTVVRSPIGLAEELKKSVAVMRKPTITRNQVQSKVIQPQLVVPTQGFVIEDGVTGRMPGNFDDSNGPLVENPPSDMAWYTLYFKSKEHDIFIAGDREDPFVLTIVREVERVNGVDYYQYRAIVFLETGNEQVSIPVQAEETLTAGQVLEIACPALADRANSLRRFDRNSPLLPELQKQLLVSENEQYVVDLKFGVLFAKLGQTNEREMFGNEHASPAFERFLLNLGDKIALKGWTAYRGGLNVTTDTSGTHSIFSRFSGYNVMFHVSTMLPYSTIDAQQLERKRHIGNDLVTIVFQDEPGIRWVPTTISSQFLHVFIVIELCGMDKDVPLYRINVICNERVPAFGPVLPRPPILRGGDQLRNFVLSKLINAEKAAYMAPAFQSRRKRTLRGIQQVIYDKFYAEAKKNTHQTRLDSEAQTVTRSLPSSQSMADLATVSGSSANLSGVQDDPRKWTVSVDVDDYPADFLCADALYHSDVLYGTTERLLVHSDGVVTEVKTDKVRRFEQVKVVDDMGIFVVLTSSGGSSNIYWANMPDLRTHSASLHKVADTKNTTIFDVIVSDSNELHLCTAAKRTLQVFVWQPTTSLFVRIKDFTLGESIAKVKFVKEDLIVAGTVGGDFIRVNTSDRSCQPIPVIKDEKTPFVPVAISPAVGELVLSYNSVTMIVSIDGKQLRDVHIKWSQTPIAVAYLFPVIVGVMPSQLELRSIINGNLLETRPLVTSRVLGSMPSAKAYHGRLYCVVQQGSSTVYRLAHGADISKGRNVDDA